MVSEERCAPELRGSVKKLKTVGKRFVECYSSHGELTVAANRFLRLFDRARRLPQRHANSYHTAQPCYENKSECPFQLESVPLRLPNILEHDLRFRTTLIVP